MNNLKSHLFIAFGFLILAIFIVRGMEAFQNPGFGVQKVYIVGGFIVAGLLIRKGWSLRD